VALGLCLILSGAAHCVLFPIHVPTAFEVNDVEGEPAIPVDLLDRGELGEPAAPAVTSAVAASANEPATATDLSNSPSRRADKTDADAEATQEAGKPQPSPSDAALPDGGGDGSLNAADAASELDAFPAPEIAHAPDAGASPEPGGPEAIVGAAGAVQADVVLVMLLINTEVIRASPVGAELSPLLRALPQWADFLRGTPVDPIEDVDWLLISGPSLIHTERDVVLIHYGAPAAVVEHAVAEAGRRDPRGGPFSVGVPGVRASHIFADGAERAILRPAPHVLAVVPPDFATKIAKELAGARVPARVLPGQAVYLRLVNPHHPFPEIPESITEMRLRVLPRQDGGADVFVDGDTQDAATASQAGRVLGQVVRRHNDTITSLLTHGLLDGVETGSNENRVEMRLRVTRDEIETLIALVGGFLGVEPPPAPSGTPPALPSRR
jgi:hypothetical protein